MILLVMTVDEGSSAPPRTRGWREIALSAWGTDILRERSFVYLVASRFFILAGAAFLINLSVPYLERAQGMTDPDERFLWINIATGTVALCTALATIPAARLSNRLGRKRVIYAACAVGAIGMTVCALAPERLIFVGGAILVGVAAGSFLAVDWALMTDIIPKAESGRYMGISNVATATNGVLVTIVGGVVVDAFVSGGDPAFGPRAAFLIGPVFFTLGALLLRPVDERRREDPAPPVPDGEMGISPAPAA
jgi:MFS family permease